MQISSICCLGGSRTGGPVCAVMALKCPEIRFTVLDNSRTVIDWNSDNLPFYEPGLQDILKKCRNRNLFFSSDFPPVIKEADMIFISVNDTCKSLGSEMRSADIKQLEDAARLITNNAITDKIIVEKSTFSPKVNERINVIFNSLCVPGVNIEVISCPEFLTEGSAVQNLLNPDQILIGIRNSPKSRAAAQSLREIYERWVPAESIVIINMKSAELAKMAANVFLAQRLSSINSFAEICEITGGDVSEVAKIVGQHPKIGPKYLQASLGFGGFNKEISNLVFMCESAKLIDNARFWKAVLDFNNYHKKKFIQKIESMLSPLKGKEIGIWGFSYKKNTSDTKFSPAIDVCCKLLVKGAKIKIFDPKVKPNQIIRDLEADIAELGQKVGEAKMENVSFCDDPYKACENAHAVVLCMDWDEFDNMHFSKVAHMMKKPIFFDGKRVLDPTILKNSGIELYSIGLSGFS